MGRLGMMMMGTAAIAAIVATAAVLRPHSEMPRPDKAGLEQAGSTNAASGTMKPGIAARGAVPTLYCEFTNFADRTRLVGFYFTIEQDGPKPVYAQIFQREQDGTQDDFGGPRAPRPAWTYDDTQSPPVIHSPDDALQINLYDYDPTKPGSNWFEAGLRRVRYRNLGGKCRHSAA